jgi:hypothetical protein
MIIGDGSSTAQGRSKQQRELLACLLIDRLFL